MSFRPLNGPLAGRAVFLSASVPSGDGANQYRRIPQAFARIEEAALRVAGAVFNAGGTLVFGGHPSISPLIGYLCEQYQPLVEAEGQNLRVGEAKTATGALVWLCFKARCIEKRGPPQVNAFQSWLAWRSFGQRRYNRRISRT